MADDPSQDVSARTAPEAIAERLNVVARQHFPAASGIARLQRVTAGATQEIWRFELLQGGGETPMILRRAPGGTRVSDHRASAWRSEAELLRAAAAAGVPVPAVRHVLTPEDGLGHGFIMALRRRRDAGRTDRARRALRRRAAEAGAPVRRDPGPHRTRSRSPLRRT